MTFDEYQAAALRTRGPSSLQETVVMCGLGLTGESGEVADLIKKWVFHGHGLEPAQMRKELGDVLWYLAVLADALGLTLSEVADSNIAKLMARYPDGFSSAASLHRTT